MLSSHLPSVLPSFPSTTTSCDAFLLQNCHGSMVRFHTNPMVSMAPLICGHLLKVICFWCLIHAPVHQQLHLRPPSWYLAQSCACHTCHTIHALLLPTPTVPAGPHHSACCPPATPAADGACCQLATSTAAAVCRLLPYPMLLACRASRCPLAMPAAARPPLFACYPPHAACYLLTTDHRLLPHCMSCTTHCVPRLAPPVVRCALFASYSPSAIYHPLPTTHHVPPATHHPPATAYRALPALLPHPSLICALPIVHPLPLVRMLPFAPSPLRYLALMLPLALTLILVLTLSFAHLCGH
jgi:hypothetical protein